VSAGFERIEDLDDALPEDRFRPRALPREAAFLAGKCFVACRRRGGDKRSPLPDFFIGAHAAVTRLTLLTRDAARYRSYFPRLKLIAPDGDQWVSMQWGPLLPFPLPMTRNTRHRYP